MGNGTEAREMGTRGKEYKAEEEGKLQGRVGKGQRARDRSKWHEQREGG